MNTAPFLDTTVRRKRRNLERLAWLPVVAALLGVWGLTIALTLSERQHTLDRIQGQLGLAAMTLADFTELAEQSTGDLGLRAAEHRTAAIWRVLLQYPTARIWVESDDGTLPGGEPPPDDLSAHVLVQDAREGFTVHAALPMADALAEWQDTLSLRAITLLAASVAFVLLTAFLIRALRQRSVVEHELITQRERQDALLRYKEELEQTVLERTRDLEEANEKLRGEKEKIDRMARTDALTGLANRRTFIEQLERQFAAAGRGGAGFAIMYIDLDHFKTINDTLGHHVGDELLCEAARRLRACARETDVVARLGGDEFAVLQTAVKDAASAGTLAGAIRESMSRPFRVNGNELRITTSIGICPWEPDSEGPDAMLAQADLALYRSKEEGRNRWRFHSDELDDEVLHRVKMTEELRAAIENCHLELRFEPRLSLATGEEVGSEAVLTWKHPSHGELAAERFLPVAERSGAIVALGRWLVEETCRQLRARLDAGEVHGVPSLPLFPAQLRNDHELVDFVRSTLESQHLSAAHLGFDVSEAALVQTVLGGSDTLDRLRALGVAVTLVDFGGEQSVLAALRHYGVQQVKLAPGLREEGGAAALRDAALGAARALRIDVVQGADHVAVT